MQHDGIKDSFFLLFSEFLVCEFYKKTGQALTNFNIRQVVKGYDSSSAKKILNFFQIFWANEDISVYG